MATTPNGADALGRVRDALLDAGRNATRLAESVERLEGRYTRIKNPEPRYFYVPTEGGTWGRTLEQGWMDHAPNREQRPRRDAIDATLALRAAVDSAMEAVAGVVAYMDGDGQAVDQRWTTRTIGHLRKLRGAILRGHGANLFPSALPMIRAGVPNALRTHAEHVSRRMEEVKSAIVAGTKPRTPTVSVSPGLLDWLYRAADPHEQEAKEHDLGVQRLRAVQATVRMLAHEHGWLAQAIRESFEPFVALDWQYFEGQQELSACVSRHLDDPTQPMPTGDGPPDPGSADPDELGRFSEQEFRVIALLRLGRLAGAGQVRKLLPTPEPIPFTARGARQSLILGKVGRFKDEPENPRFFPPELAEEMLRVVEGMVRTASGGGGGGGGAKSKANGHLRKLPSGDGGEYQPATWFPKGMAARLRMAAQKKRKTKRVATRTIDGVVCYLVADARRWWPKDVPNESK